MTSIKEQVLLTIKSNSGLSLSEVQSNLHEEAPTRINSAIKELIEEGQVIYSQERYFPTQRRIMGYDKNHDGLVEEIELPDLTAAEVRSILEPYQDDPLFYDCYELSIDTATFFVNRYKINLDFERHDYFLEACYDPTIVKNKKNNS